ncbi:conserved protein of unknown function [Hyphomicrobium sp. MC1]|nr:conserved protein of unknown function [Hyphomicrobium sp. MC1]
MRSHHIDSSWPYQVALRADVTTGKAHDVVRSFCKDLSLSPRGHSFHRDDQSFNVWCFAEEEHALKFIARFGGEMIAVEDRPKWPGAKGRKTPNRRR